ncbi:hypothetical protein [Billgrantia aerodenitrificans]|uniref:HEAT repeat domain-containing protein n=1 Tax=Billgrantia aerodenitrificans TaxID=2733483 RepID=A0ABS9ATS3_9GAMM|nr:hypothetical protein [Halomonas aerodenitrificans]MCE8025154.1 hypothetical protein [Halomonas aerodenitrificans]
MPSSRLTGALTLLLFLYGCAGPSRAPAPQEAPSPEQVEPATTPPPAAVSGTTREDRFWVPPHFASQDDEIHYYISRLADRRFIDVYGGEEHPRVWYIAAERLGQIGEPAVPMLYALIDTRNQYELMLVLYALQLATQDPQLMAQTGGDYVRLSETLSESANADNREIAQAWWERHGWRWQ